MPPTSLPTFYLEADPRPTHFRACRTRQNHSAAQQGARRPPTAAAATAALASTAAAHSAKRPSRRPVARRMPSKRSNEDNAIQEQFSASLHALQTESKAKVAKMSSEGNKAAVAVDKETERWH